MKYLTKICISPILIFQFIFLILSTISLISYQLTGNPQDWLIEDFIGFDEVGDCTSETGDISSVFVKTEVEKTILRITFDDMITRKDNKMFQDNFSEIYLQILFLHHPFF